MKLRSLVMLVGVSLALSACGQTPKNENAAPAESARPKDREAAKAPAVSSEDDELEMRLLRKIRASGTGNDAEVTARVEPLLKKYPGTLELWVLRAEIALRRGELDVGKQAGNTIQALQAKGQTSADAESAMALLDKRGWLEKATVTGAAQKPKSLNLGGGVKLDLVWIPAGQFMMGSNEGENDEKPVHLVKITKGFWMGKTEVTQAQYKRLMGNNPANFSGSDDLPVEQVSWDDSVKFCAALQDICEGGVKVRLPTEAEWEYACRAGTTGHYNHQPLDAAAWYDETSGNAKGENRSTHPVARKKANAWGLYDMHGNVWEWCADWYGGDYYNNSAKEDPAGPSSGGFRVCRGGSWDFTASLCRSANRDFNNYFDPDARRDFIGFRVVVSPEGS